MTGVLRNLLKRLFLGALRGLIVPGVILAVAASAAGLAEKTGDRLQVALPLLGWGCAAANGDGLEYAGRYLVMFGLAHGSKRVLGEAPINRRPHGGGQGMPSAHSSTAALGASRLVSDCLAGQPVAQAVSVLAAGFVGASRISAGAHDIWQVLAGIILGLVCDRACRGAFGGLAARLRRWLPRLRPGRGGRG
jgi:membrane-associated phospholipid phosphatase